MLNKSFWNIFYLLLTVPLLGQQYSTTVYSSKDGLHLEQIGSLISIHNGSLWLGSNAGGLYSFDGKTYQRFNSTDGLGSPFVAELITDEEENIWIATDSGLQLYADNFQEYYEFNLKYPPVIRSIAKGNDSTIWVGTESGLYQFDIADKRFYPSEEIHILSSARINCLTIIDKNLWIGTDKGLFKKGKEVISFHQYEGLDDANVLEIIPVGDEIWFLTEGNGLYSYSGNEITGNIYFSELEGSTCMTLHKDSEIWIGTVRGDIFIYNVKTGDQEILNESNGLNSNKILSISEDLFGNIWAGTEDGRLMKIFSEQFIKRKIDLSDGDNSIVDIISTPENILLLHEKRGLLKLTNNSFVPLWADTLDRSYLFNCAVRENPFRYWLGSERFGLFLYDGEDLNRYGLDKGSLSKNITDLAMDSLGFIWVSTNDRGIFQIEKVDSSLSLGYILSKSEGLPENNIDIVEVDPDNNIWFVSSSGQIGKITNGEIAGVYSLASGRRNTSVNHIAFTESGKMLFGTAGNGIFVSDIFEESFSALPFDLENGLNSDHIRFIQPDDKLLWVGTNIGVEKVRITDSGSGEVLWRIGSNQGVIPEFHNGSVGLDNEDNIWVGTEGGVYQYHQGVEEVREYKPIVHIDRMEILYEPVSFSRRVGSIKQLSPEENDIGIFFSAIDINRPSGIEYRWRFKDSGSGWSKYSEQQSVHFADLESGAYIFEVQARSGIMEESNIDSIYFEIKAPLWDRIWFKIILAVLFSFALFGLWRLRLSALKKAESRKRDELELRNELLELEQKAMQLQMNPHFIFNSLNSIQALIATGDDQRARKQLSKFARLMRSILNNSRSSFVELDEEIEMLRGYIEFEQFSKPDLFEYKIDIDEKVDVEAFEIPPMLIQPFIENSIHHGFPALKDRKGKLLLRFEKRGETLICIIRDNGIGRQRSGKLKKDIHSHRSSGIDITRERLRALGRNKRETVLMINDVINERGDINGTEVTMKIKYKSKY